MGKNKKPQSSNLLPFVSICTPTFNRRPFYPMIIECFNNQTYPKDRMEWIIIDDGTDKIEDLVKNIPQVKYFKYDTKMNLGKKRNLMHEKSKGEIIIYMDDDDYYPAERVSHAVETLQKNPKALCAGSSEMYIYFKHIHKMYKFGPYGANHSTAATFAFRRELLKQTKYDDNAALAEERLFLKNYTIPFVQLDSMKSILVFSHIHNSFDKKQLLEQLPNPYVTLSEKTIDDFVKEPNIKQFFMDEIDTILGIYEPGRPEHKPEVFKQMAEITKQREEMARQKQQNNQIYENKLSEQSQIINNLLQENNMMKTKIEYLENKMREIIQKSIAEKKTQL
jgi:glycosyltransferase involved in cell wall biosynthesis|uniref:Glycosyltransferase 2-like domain-containing protein n=1 Tax=viral metagenome TaxID=1070528 RepID=A0A6C0D744_9ZZZZ